MSMLEKRSFDSPDEARPFQAHGKAEVVMLGDFTIGKGPSNRAGDGQTTSSRSPEPIPARSDIRVFSSRAG